jgi:VCBS repeat-containing protein
MSASSVAYEYCQRLIHRISENRKTLSNKFKRTRRQQSEGAVYEALENRLLLSGADVAIAYVNDDWAALTVGIDPDGAGPAGELGVDAFASIQDAIDNLATDGTIHVADGTYNENLSITQNLTLISDNGRDVTFINGISGVGALGTITISNATTGVQIGDNDQGFSILGIDNGNAAVENAAIYFQGTNTGTNIIGNDVIANGDHGLLTEYGQAVTNILIDSNIFSGQTFTGANPGGLGFSSQFSTANVPRQLVAINGGTSSTNSNIFFTNNDITGTAGGINIDGDEQGNTLVTIDAQNSIIIGNTFEGTTTRYGAALRARGSGNATITNNSFISTNMGDNTSMLYTDMGSINGPYATLNTKIVDFDNDFDGGAYLDGGKTVTTGIEGIIENASAGSTIHVLAGEYDADITITEDNITVYGPSSIYYAPGTAPRLSRGEAEITGGFRVQGDNVTLAGLTILEGVGPAGIGDITAIHLAANTTGHTITNNIITGTDASGSRGIVASSPAGAFEVSNNDISEWTTGLYINPGSDGVEVSTNNIHDNFVGMSADNATNLTVANNFFADNAFEHIGLGAPSTGVAIEENSFDADSPSVSNYGGVEIDASLNWWGTTDLALIGNNLTANASADVDYSPIVNVGTDTDSAYGFQPDTSNITVHTQGSQSDSFALLAEGLSAVIGTSGTFIINGQYTGTLALNGGITIGGDFDLAGALSLGGNITLAPGNSPASISTGDLTMSSGTTLAIELLGTTAGTDYDQVNVTGTVDITGATLDLTLGYYPATTGDSFTIIKNDAADAIVGTFAGLAEGATFTLSYGGVDFNASITYVGGDGNDVVITTAAYAVTDVYVDDDWASLSIGDDPDGAGPLKGIGFDAFANIQDAIDAVDAGGTVHIAAGDYDQGTININKNNITLLGAQSGVNASSRDNVDVTDETVIHGSIYVNHNIDGTTIDGLFMKDFTVLSLEYFGVFVSGGAANTTVQNVYFQGTDPSVSQNGIVTSIAGTTNNIFTQNVYDSTYYGVYLNPNSVGNQVTDSLIINTRIGYVIDTAENTTVTGNTFDSSTGVYFWDGGTASVGDNTGYTVANNTFQNGTGVRDSYITVNDPGITVDLSNNVFDGKLPSAMTLSELFDLEDKITHAIDDAAYDSLGIVVADNLYVTQLSGSIQNGIDAATTGDTLHVQAGTFTENLTVDKTLQIIGAGSGSTILEAGSAVGINITAGGTSAAEADRLLISGMTINNAASMGIVIDGTVSYITIDDVDVNVDGVKRTDYGLEIAASANVTDLLIDNSSFSTNDEGAGMHVHGSIDGLTITDSEFEGNNIGFYAFQVDGSNTILNNVNISGSSFSDNTYKGMYIEKLSNALLDSISVNNSGTLSGTTDGLAGYEVWPTGIDLNLKYYDYENITIQNSYIVDSGSANPANGVGLAVKTRDDGSYATHPATLDGLTITGNVINGAQTSVRFGEPGKNNTGLTNLDFSGNDISSSLNGIAVDNQTADQIDASGNYWGTLSWHGYDSVVGIKDRFHGDVIYNNWASADLSTTYTVPTQTYTSLDNAGMAEGNAGDNGGIFGYNAFVTIIDSYNHVEAGGDINIDSGSYDEKLNITKSVNLLGANAGIHAAVGTNDSESVGVRGDETVMTADNKVFTISADNITIDGFKFTGEDHEIIYSNTDAHGFHLTNSVFDFSDYSETAYSAVVKFNTGNHNDVTVDFNSFNNISDYTLWFGSGTFDNIQVSSNYMNNWGNSLFWTGGEIVDGVIEYNEIDGYVDEYPTEPGLGTINIGKAGNLAIRNNWFHDTMYTPIQVGMVGGSITNNVFERIHSYASEGTEYYNGAAIQLWGGTWNTPVATDVTISGNIIHYNDVAGQTLPTNGIQLNSPDDEPGIDGSTIHIFDNLFVDGGVNASAHALIHNGDQSTTLDADANAFISSAQLADLVSGPVDFSYILSNTDDADLNTMGFQPDYSYLIVHAAGTQTDGNITEALNAVEAGGLVEVLDGTYTDNITVDGTTTLKGTFTLNGTMSVADGATFAPGNSPAIVNTGDFSMTTGTTLEIELDGPNVGTEYDQVNVTGTVDITDATLDVALNYLTTTNNEFIIVNNDGVDAVVGTFNGLAEGDTISIDGVILTISYVGGDGNDISLSTASNFNVIYVDDDWAGTTIGQDPDAAGPAGIYGVNAFDNITDALAAVNAGGTINVLAGQYSEHDMVVDKAVSIVGEGSDVVTVNHYYYQFGHYTTGFDIQADDISISGMTLEDAVYTINVFEQDVSNLTFSDLVIQNTQGVYYAPTAIRINNSIASNINIDNVEFYEMYTGISVGGLEGDIVNGLSVTNSKFISTDPFRDHVGISTGAPLTNLVITDSLFSGNEKGITSSLNGDTLIENNTFIDNDFGILFGKGSAAAIDENAEVVVHNNQFMNNAYAALRMDIFNDSSNRTLDIPVTISNNTITQDVSLYTIYPYQCSIDIALMAGQTHETVNIIENNITLTGTPTSKEYGAIAVRGGLTDVNIERNTIDGGNVGTNSGIVATSGIMLSTNSVNEAYAALIGEFDSSDSLYIANNIIHNFDSAFSIIENSGYISPSYLSSLPTGAQVVLYDNDLSGNTAGIVALETGEAVDASNNWWGSSDVATVAAYNTGIVDFSPFLESGTDTNLTYAGFQGDFSHLYVHQQGSQTTGLISEALASVANGGTITVLPGTYDESLGLNNDITLQGTFGLTDSLQANDGNIIAPGYSAGQITTSDLTLNSGSTLQMELDGATAGTEYDQMVVNGTVTLNAATLDLSLNFNPTSGEDFVIIDNDGSDAVIGTFAGLAEGAVITLTDSVSNEEVEFTVTYVGGDGNDVVLTTNNPPSANNVDIDATEDGPAVIENFDGVDTDSGDTLTYQIVDLPAFGSVINNNDGTFSFTAGDFPNLNNGETKQVTFTYKAIDSQGEESGLATVTVTIAGVTEVHSSQNGYPNGAVDDAFTSSDLPVDIDAVANDYDPDGDTLHVYSVDSVSTLGATITKNPDGTIHYDPGSAFDSYTPGQVILDQFSYQLQDPYGDYDYTIVNVYVTVVDKINDAPVAQNVEGNVVEDADVTLAFNANDQDTDDNPSTLTYSIVDLPSVGSVINNNDGTFSYIPGDLPSLDYGQTQQVTFTYKATDSHGLESNTATVTITINGQNEDNPDNDAPVALGVAGNVSEDGPATVFAFNADDADSDDDPTTLTYTITSTPANGVLINNGDGTFSFDPDGDFEAMTLGQTQNVVFTYIATDSHGVDSNAATVTITVAGANETAPANNHGPNGAVDSAYTQADILVNINVLENDIEPDGDTVTVASLKSSTSDFGVPISINADGTIKYDPNGYFNHLAPGEVYRDSFKYTVTDPYGLNDTTIVFVYVVGVDNSTPNAAPTAGSVNNSTSEDLSITLSFDGADADDPQSNLTYNILSSPAAGSVTNNGDGTFTFNPGADFQSLNNGQTDQVSFTYEVVDPHGAVSNTATVTITIEGADESNGSNNAPIAQNVVGNVLEDSGAHNFNFSSNDIDADDDSTTLTYTILTSPAEGNVINNNNGSFTFNPGSGFQDLGIGESRQVTFTYKTTDSHGVDSNTATVTITVSGTNDGTVAVPNLTETTVNQAIDIDVLSNDFDRDGDTVSMVSVDLVSSLGVSLSINANGTIHYDPSTALSSLTPGTTVRDSFRYTMTDPYGQQDGNLVFVDVTANTVTITSFSSSGSSLSSNTPKSLANTINGLGSVFASNGSGSGSAVNQAAMAWASAQASLKPAGPALRLGSNISLNQYDDSDSSNQLKLILVSEDAPSE